jgi:hypothetical protein
VNGSSARSSRNRAAFRDRRTPGSNTNGGQDRPNVTAADPNLPGDRETIARWFNTGALVAQQPGTFGNAGGNTIIGPGIFNVDASIIRNFRMMRTKTRRAGGHPASATHSLRTRKVSGARFDGGFSPLHTHVEPMPSVLRNATGSASGFEHHVISRTRLQARSGAAPV